MKLKKIKKYINKTSRKNKEKNANNPLIENLMEKQKNINENNIKENKKIKK